MISDRDARFMAAALRLGRRGLGLAWPNPSVACLIARAGDGAPILVGRGVTARGGRPHAETIALQEAGAAARGATAYVTLEPCSHVGKTGPCADALIAAGIARVVVALADPDPRVAGRGIARLRAAGLEVVENVLSDIAARDHAGHVMRVARGRPFVTLKMALSADGKTGLPGRKVAITGEAANARVHMMRAMSDAILIGIGTALADDPLLNVRLPGLGDRSPLRVVLDGDLRLAPHSRLAASAREVPLHVIAGLDADLAREAMLVAMGAKIHRVPRPWLSGRGVNLAISFRELVKLGITRLLVEGGLRLAAALLDHDLVDEAVLFESPEPIGVEGLAALKPGPLDRIVAGDAFSCEEARVIGRDRMTVFARRR